MVMRALHSIFPLDGFLKIFGLSTAGCRNVYSSLDRV